MLPGNWRGFEEVVRFERSSQSGSPRRSGNRLSTWFGPTEVRRALGPGPASWLRPTRAGPLPRWPNPWTWPSLDCSAPSGVSPMTDWTECCKTGPKPTGTASRIEEEDRRIAKKLECHYTSKLVSRLNMAEIECSIICRNCLGQRPPSREASAGRSNPWSRSAMRLVRSWTGSSPPQMPGENSIDSILPFLA